MMYKAKQLISVIIPVYNGEKYLKEAIESVRAQSYHPIEIIIVDDGSTDGTAEIAKQYESLNYYFQSNAGLAAALNLGIEIAAGDYYAFLDADDIWLPDKLRLQMNVFHNNSEVEMVFGHHQRFYSSEMSESKTSKQDKNKILPGLFKGTLLIKKNAFWTVGLFDTRWKVGDFIDWYKRAMEIGLNMVMLPDILLRRRIHNKNMSRQIGQINTDYVRIVKAALDRQKRRGNSRLESPSGHKNQQNES